MAAIRNANGWERYEWPLLGLKMGRPRRAGEPGTILRSAGRLERVWMLQIALPGARVHIRGADELVERQLRDLADAEPSLPDPQNIDLELRQVGERHEIWSGTHSLAESSDIDALDSLMQVLNRLTLDTDSARLHLHAACVELDGVGILLAGPSGSGKTTLTIGLLAEGAKYLTDEILTLLPGLATAFGYPKPLTIKSCLGLDAFPTLPAPVWSSTGRAAIAASALSTTAAYTHVDHVVFPRYVAEGATYLTPISRADATRRLLSDSLDVVRLGVGSLDTVANLVGEATCWELQSTDLESAVAMVRALPEPTQVVTTMLEVEAPFTKSTPRTGIRVARFPESAIAFEYPYARMIELNLEETDEFTARARGIAPVGALDRLERSGMVVPSTTAASRSVVSGVTASVPQAAGVVMGDLISALADAGIEAILDVRALEVLRTGRRCVGGGRPRVLVQARHLHSARRIAARCDSSVVVVDRLLPRRFSEAVSPGESRRWAVPVRVGGDWFKALHPLHQFFEACGMVSLASTPHVESLVWVTRLAPPTEFGAYTAITLAQSRRFIAIVQRALDLSAKHAGGVPTALVAFQAAAPLSERLEVTASRLGGSVVNTRTAVLARARQAWRKRTAK